jgi:hypothetical protein
VANRTNRTPEKDAKFFAALSAGKTVQKALSASGYKRQTVYDWRASDEEFRRQWDEATQQAVELMEAEADRRAIIGVVKPLMYQGAKVGAVREYSDTLLMFRLKALKLEKYRENVRQELTGPDGRPFLQPQHVPPSTMAEAAIILEQIRANGYSNGHTRANS